MNSKKRIPWIFLVAISPLAYLPFSHWLAVIPYGTGIFLWVGVFVYGCLLLVPLFAIPILLFCLFLPNWRKQAAIYLAASLLMIVSYGCGTIVGLKVHMAGIRSWVKREQPLIVAIRKYESEHSTPPPNLESLIPNYLPAIPDTGLAAYPEFRYHNGDEAKQEFFDNPWAVSVLTPTSLLNFDELLYFPKQNYPEVGYSGSLERIGDWTYVHE